MSSSVPFSTTRPSGKCLFWRPGEPETWNTSGCRFVASKSNLDVTTCECNHLTVFAALMDPYGRVVRLYSFIPRYSPILLEKKQDIWFTYLRLHDLTKFINRLDYDDNDNKMTMTRTRKIMLLLMMTLLMMMLIRRQCARWLGRLS